MYNVMRRDVFMSVTRLLGAGSLALLLALALPACGAGGVVSGLSDLDPIGPSPTEGLPGGGSGVAMSSGEQEFADEVLRLVNVERARAGVAPLLADPVLAQVAYAHSVDMDVRNYFGHTNPSGQDLGARLESSGVTGLRSWGENIAWGQRTPESVMRDWMESAGHRENILHPTFTHLGVGVHGPSSIWWTQAFGRR